MREIRTSGSMSEGGKRDHGRIEAPPRRESRRTGYSPTLRSPRPSSTLQLLRPVLEARAPRRRPPLPLPRPLTREQNELTHSPIILGKSAEVGYPLSPCCGQRRRATTAR